MSDVLVKGMEMPKNCKECGICYVDGSGQGYCILKDEYSDCESTGLERRFDCPLVEVPIPHGRLIDADTLVNNCEKYIKSLNPDRDGKEIAKIRWLVGILNEQSTIIEAEGSDA